MHDVHMRSLVAVGATVWRWFVPHWVSEAHVRSWVPLPFAHALVSYCVPLHVVHVPQTRSCAPLPFAQAVVCR